MGDLQIKIHPKGNLHKVTANNGLPIHADVIDIDKADDRQKFADEVNRITPGIDAKDVADELLRLAVESSKPVGTGNTITENPEETAIPLPLPAPFPSQLLPAPLRNFVDGMAVAMGVPPEVLAVPVLGVCASAIGSTCRVWINPSWSEACVLWLVMLMESGELKTPAYKAAMRPLVVMQGKAEREYQEKMAAFEQSKLEHEVAVSGWKKDKMRGDSPVKPEEPAVVDFFTTSTTMEAMAMMQLANRRGVPLSRDELSGWFGSFDQYRGGKGDDVPNWLELYTGGTIKVNRVAKRIFVPNASSSIFGTCQPKVFFRAVKGDPKRGDADQIDNGMFARFLVCRPIVKPKVWLPGTLPAGVGEDYADLVNKLLSIPLPFDDDGQTKPKDIPLSLGAQKRFAQFVNEHGLEKAQVEDEALRYHYAKLEGVAARLALIVHICRWAAGEDVRSDAIDLQSIEAGIELANWFKVQAQIVYGQFFENPGQQLQRELVELIRRQGGALTARELTHSSRRYREPGAAESAIEGLVKAGIGRWETEPQDGRGRPAIRFILGTNTGGNGNTIGKTAGISGIPLPLPPAPAGRERGEL